MANNSDGSGQLVETDRAEGLSRPRRSTARRAVVWSFMILSAGAVAAGFAALSFAESNASESPSGQRFESSWELPSGVAVPSLVDASARWGLAERRSADSADPMAGGLAVGDIDRDGDLDLLVAHGTIDIYRWEGDRFGERLSFSEGAMAISVFDVDQDGWLDLLIARSENTDLVVWGGSWTRQLSLPPDITELPGTAPTAALLAAELSGDAEIDLIRLGRGSENGEADIIWLGDADRPRMFDAASLGKDARLSLAAEFVDVDRDGLLDVWVTRDVGWDTGPDSLYSRQGDADGPWADIAPALGADLAVDGMGVTLADLDGDLLLDAYVSDIGDNEVLLWTGDSFTSTVDTGAARIRPPGARNDVISSSWGSGAIDANLDGQLDLVVSNGGFASGGMRNKVAGTTIVIEDSPAVLLGIGDGRFVDVWSELGLPAGGSGRGLTVADFDADGDDDIVVVLADGSLRVLENTMPGPSITVSPAPGCDPTGAVVSVASADRTYTTLFRSHTFGGSHSPETIVGWPTAGTATVTVEWLDGSVTGHKIVGPSGRQGLVVDC